MATRALVTAMQDGLEFLATSVAMMHVQHVLKTIQINVQTVKDIRLETSVSFVSHIGSLRKIVQSTALMEHTMTATVHVRVMKDGPALPVTSGAIPHVNIVFKTISISAYLVMETRQVNCVSSVSRTGSHLELAMLSVIMESTRMEGLQVYVHAMSDGLA